MLCGKAVVGFQNLSLDDELLVVYRDAEFVVWQFLGLGE